MLLLKRGTIKFLDPREFLREVGYSYYAYEGSCIYIKKYAILLLESAVRHYYHLNRHDSFALHFFGNGKILSERFQHTEILPDGNPLYFMALADYRDGWFVGETMWGRNEIEEERKKRKSG